MTIGLGIGLGITIGGNGSGPAVIAPAYLTGTPMETLSLTVQPGVYSFVPSAYTRQMQVSDDGVSGWTNTGSPFSGTTFTINSLTGKYLRVVETASLGSISLQTTSAALGPVVAAVALAAKPLAAGSKLHAIGDSQMGYNDYFGSVVGSGNTNGLLAAVTTGYGFIEWAKCYDPRFDFIHWYDPADPLGRGFNPANQGLFGDHLGVRGTVPGIIPRIPGLITKMQTAGGKVVVFNGGFNTIHSDDDESAGTAPYCISKLDAGLTLFRKAGIDAILLVPYPTTAWPVGDTRYTTLASVQAWCRAQSTRDGVTVLDATDVIAPSGVVDATMLRSDGIHLSVKAASTIGKTLFLPIIQALFAAGSTFDQNEATSNLLTASQVAMSGTGGTKSGSPLPTGTVPDNYQVARNRNCTIACSITTDSNGKPALQLAVTPGGADSGNYYELQISPPDVTIVTGEPSKWYQSYFRVELSEMQDVPFPEVLYGFYVGSSTAVIRSIGMGRESSGDYDKQNLAGAQAFWVSGPPVYNQPGSTTINRERGFLRFTGNKGAAPFTIKLSRPIVREIPDPRSSWGY